jgi:tetratricopeptide (TPR) repeat protein
VNADFKNYEKLSEVYTLLAENSPEQGKKYLLHYAMDNLWSAVERYPTSDRLRFELAETAEKLGKTDIAVAQYEKAIEIEDDYRNQFKIMYPGREIFSRLGEAQIPSPGLGDEFFALRPYRAGDDVRRVHWRRVARTGRWVVVENEASAGVAVMLELGRSQEPEGEIEQDGPEGWKMEESHRSLHSLWALTVRPFHFTFCTKKMRRRDQPKTRAKKIRGI